MVLGIPGGRGLFSTLQAAFKQPDTGRLRLTPEIHDFLADFRWLAKDLHRQKTRLTELVPQPPISIGACDASGLGMGGVHFIHDDETDRACPLVWRQRFANHITADLVSFSNPTGSINNSDLELAGTIAQHDTLPSHGHAGANLPHHVRQHACRGLATERLHVHHRSRGVPTLGPSAPSTLLPLRLTLGPYPWRSQRHGRRCLPTVGPG